MKTKQAYLIGYTVTNKDNQIVEGTLLTNSSSAYEALKEFDSHMSNKDIKWVNKRWFI